MTFPTYQSTTPTSSASSTTHNVSMPATVNAGDLLLCLGVYINTAGTLTTPAGWTLLLSSNTSTWKAVFYKVAAGTEGGGTVNFGQSNAAAADFQVHRYTSWDGTLAGVEANGTFSSGGGVSPNSASLTPSWGALDTYWVTACFEINGGATTSISAYPASYSNGAFASPGTTHGVGSANRQLNATSEDPGAFTITATGVLSFAITIAIRPAIPPSATGAPNLPHLTATASGKHAQKATGTPTLPHLTATAAAKHKQIATAVDTLPHLTAAGSATMTSPNATGTAAPTLPHLTVAAAGIHKQSATGAPTLPHLTALATGVMQPKGAAAATLPHLTAAATAKQIQSSSGAATLAHLTATAAGLTKQQATGATVLPHLTALAAGILTQSATGSPTLPHLTATASGKQSQTGAASATLAHLTAAGIARVAFRATGAAVLARLTSSGEGGLRQTFEGTAAVALAAMRVTAYAVAAFPFPPSAKGRITGVLPPGGGRGDAPTTAVGYVKPTPTPGPVDPLPRPPAGQARGRFVAPPPPGGGRGDAPPPR